MYEMEESSILRKLKFPQTAILFELNIKNNYAKVLEDENIYGKVVKNYPRTLNLLKDYGLLSQTTVQPKNKKIYSINEDAIALLFIERLVQKSREILPKGKIPKYDYLGVRVWHRRSDVLRDLIKSLKKMTWQIKKSDKKEREILSRFLLKKVFISAYNARFNGTMIELFDETIIGIGKAFEDYRGLIDNTLMGKIEFICENLAKFMKLREMRTNIAESYKNFKKGIEIQF